MNKEKTPTGLSAPFPDITTGIQIGQNIANNGEIIEDAATISWPVLRQTALVFGEKENQLCSFVLEFLEKTSRSGIPVLMPDVNNNFINLTPSGMISDKISENYTPSGDTAPSDHLTVEWMTIDDEPGIRVRGTIADFGPQLLKKMLALTDSAGETLKHVFGYCSDEKLPAADLDGFGEVIQHLIRGGQEDHAAIGIDKFPVADMQLILSEINRLKTSGASSFLGEKSFEVEDFIRHDKNGSGIVNILRIGHFKNHPGLYTIFLWQLMIKMYLYMPETGMDTRPKLSIIISSAEKMFEHLDADELVQLTTILKGLSARGVGVCLASSKPAAIPADVFDLPGMIAFQNIDAGDGKILNALQKIPYQTMKIPSALPPLTIHEFRIRTFNRQNEAVLIRTEIQSPHVQIQSLTTDEIQALTTQSPLFQKYNQPYDQRTAYQIVLAAIAGEAQNSVIPAEDFVAPRTISPEKKDKEGRISRLLKRLSGQS